MDYYVDVVVRPDPEFSTSTLISAIFSKLHLALVRVGQGEIGVSFPKIKLTLGDCLRIHGSKLALGRLMDDSWLRGLQDYAQLRPIRSTPVVSQYCVVRRVHVKSSQERLLRRSVRKGWISEEEAQERLLTTKNERSKLPYILLRSSSTGEHYRMFIQQELVLKTGATGSFNTFGLSESATVPYF
ncbi:MAG TPA: type I-F CRISPR-associated endoribonuclease Cas6/Csy4 [Burkholderiaceae bacterium]|nr:type I-F CRISPR-associated endoribonuclease Cas6/Csy4 [Burkholderiaceae bacterium]